MGTGLSSQEILDLSSMDKLIVAEEFKLKLIDSKNSKSNDHHHEEEEEEQGFDNLLNDGDVDEDENTAHRDNDKDDDDNDNGDDGFVNAGSKSNRKKKNPLSKEFEAKKIPFIVQRPLPNGACEYWRLSDLEIL